jgi:hypothetical protein
MRSVHVLVLNDVYSSPQDQRVLYLQYRVLTSLFSMMAASSSGLYQHR